MQRATELGDLKGSTVTALGPTIAPDVQGYRDSFAAFTHCTGATVSYDGSTEFETQLGDRLGSGDPPDMALFSTPELLTRYTQRGLKELSPDVLVFADKYFPDDWRSYGTIDAPSFGIPASVDFKSLVWYSPKIFNIKGYTVPATLHELQELTDQIAGTGQQQPWCVSDETTTGWQITDWLEEYVLRTSGPDVSDQWVSHDVKFADAPIADALAQVGDVLQQPGSVFGEDVAVLPPAAIVNGDCPLTLQSADFEANFPADTVHPAGDVNAFVMPPTTVSDGQTGRVGGTFYGAFSDRPEVQAFQYFVASPEFANTRAVLGGDISRTVVCGARTCPPSRGPLAACCRTQPQRSVTTRPT